MLRRGPEPNEPRTVRILRAARKLSNLAHSRNRIERLAILSELRISRTVDQWTERDRQAVTASEFRNHAARVSSELSDLLAPNGQAEQAVQNVQARFSSLADGRVLPFPAYFNADASFGMFCYAFARALRPDTVIEVGVGYGTSSALLLRALAENRHGRLISLDMPPLGDYKGEYTGMVVKEDLRQRWTLLSQRGSRTALRPILDQCSSLDLFIGDGGSVSSLQRFEVKSVWPHLSSGGWAIVNNAALRFTEWARELPGASVFEVWQTQKTGRVTALIEKRPFS